MKIQTIISGMIVASTFTPIAFAGTVNVYSYRQEFLMKPILDKFEAETGHTVNFLYAGKGLTQRLKQEGKNSPADVLLTTDIGRADELASKGLVQKIDNSVLNMVKPQYRDPNGYWAAQTTRARVIYASKNRVAKGDIKTWEDLLSPKYKGKICIRDGKHSYNLGLWSSFIAHEGESYTKDYLTKLKANLARKPQGNDRAQAKAIWQGECDVAIGNSYYMGKMLNASGKNIEQQKWADSIYLIFPNQAKQGTHTNVSTATIAKNAPNPKIANELVAFLLSDTAQYMYANVNHEHPVSDAVEYSPLLKKWGRFKADNLPLSTIAENRSTAMRLIDKVGFND